MAYPNVLTYKGNGIVQYMSNTALNTMADIILEGLASANAFGNIFINDEPAGGSYSTIGPTMQNTAYDQTVGAHGTLTTSTTDYIFSENAPGSANVQPVALPPVEWSASQSEVKILDSDTLSNLADEVLNRLITNDGPGTFKIQASAPSDGGTWVSRATLADTIASGSTGNATVNVWQKVSSNPTLTDIPLTADTGGFRQMSEDEIRQVQNAVQQRIVDTNIGRYEITTTGSPPVTGTWENMGSFVDSLADTVNTNYNGPTFVGLGPTYSSYRGGPTGFLRGWYVRFPIALGRYYVGPALVNYVRVSTPYTGVYAGLEIQGTTSTQTTYTLWRRTA